MSFPRLLYLVTDVFRLGAAVTLDHCGCKFLAVFLGWLVLRVDFGRCRQP